MPRMYPDWKSYTIYLKETQDRFLNGETANVTFHNVSKIAAAVIDGLGKIQVQVCDEMTDMMVPKAVPGTGRIALSDFYSIDASLFESPETLKQLGAIDS